MIPIPLTTLIYDRGPGGTFTWQNPVSLAGRLTSYEDAIEARGGYKLWRGAFDCALEELSEWLQAGLMRGVRSYTPTGRLRWEGVLVELKATIGPVSIVRSLDDMANRIIVSYGEAGGSGDNTSIYSDAASIAEYGTKDLQLNLSTTTAAGAAQRAQTDLKALAWPISSRETTLDTATGGSVRIELRAVGRYELLDWLLTTNTTTATAVTSTQAITLLTAFNAVNNWFSTSTAEITATGHSDTQYIEPYTSYQEKLEALLSQGTSTQTALAWGIYDDGVLRIAPWAGATPTVIGYYRHAADRTVRDPYGNVIPPWDWQPDVMAEDTAILGTTASDAAIASETREYIARVSLRIDSGGVSGTLEPEILGTTSPAAVAEAAANPVGRGAVGRSARQSKVERKIKKTTRTIHQSVDNPETPILTGGGGIDTGGGTITYPPPSGGPGSPTTGTSGSGTTGAVTKWSNGPSGILGDATAGVDYASASHTHAAGDITTGTMATARLGSGSASSTTFLRGDSTWQAVSTITPADIGAAPVGAKYIVQTADATLTNEQALGSLATGLLKNTTSTGVLSIAVAGTDYAAASHTHDASDVISGTMATARLGSGTASSTRFLRGDSTWQLISSIAPADIGAAPDDATYIVQTPTSTLSAEQALSQLGTGLLKNTTSTGVLSIAAASDLPNHASRHANGGADEVALDASQVTTGTFLAARLGSGTANSSKYLAGDSTWQTAPTGTVGGTGTAGRVAQWASGGADVETSTLIKSGAGVLTLSAASAYTLTIPATGTVILGTGVNQRVPIFNGTNSITTTNLFSFAPGTGNLSIGGTVTAQGGVAWDFGSYSASGDAAITGYAVVNIAGSVRKLAIIA